jgi:hypothetical protein
MIDGAVSVTILVTLSSLTLPQLLRLRSVGATVSSLEPLRALTGLQKLDLTSGMCIKDFTSLRSFASLTCMKLLDFPLVNPSTLLSLQLAP